jgi:hypothetical protein
MERARGRGKEAQEGRRNGFEERNKRSKAGKGARGRGIPAK